jgi:hypothetical protein
LLEVISAGLKVVVLLSIPLAVLAGPPAVPGRDRLPLPFPLPVLDPLAPWTEYAKSPIILRSLYVDHLVTVLA